MADVVGVLAATAQLLDQALRVLGRIRRARQRQKALPDVLAKHENELYSIKNMIGIIQDEEDLQTANVCSEVVRLRGVQDKLVKLLDELDPRLKTPVKQFTHQLTKGSSDENKLSETMDELGHVKTMLLLRIQVANVGVMRNVQQCLVANTEVIARVDKWLREEVAECEGLRIARLLQGRRPSEDGTVILTPADLRSLRNSATGEDSEGETLVDDSDSSTGSSRKRASTERVILHNVARHQALQINAPMGNDIWKTVDSIVIKYNTAEGDAVQINYTNTPEDTMKLMRLHSELKIAERKEMSSYKRRDSVTDR